MLIYIPAKLLRDQEVVIKRAVSTDLPPPINTMFNEKNYYLGSVPSRRVRRVVGSR